MTKNEFQSNARAAEEMRRLEPSHDEAEYWIGYLRGLRRNYHGETFGTAEEHALWMSLSNEIRDQSRKMRGLGYQAGFAGQAILPAMKTLAGHQHMSELGKRGGSATSERKTTAVRQNAKLGGRPRKSDPEKNG